ncbi:MAG TPA: hypothetical protein VN153_13055 [Tahibacter sp.]|nr:hypothetical protein [Tahibacter sp.]
MFCRNVLRATGAVWLFVATNAFATNCVNYGTDLVVDGNKSVDICLRTTAGGEPRTFSYQLFGASSTWKFDSAAAVNSPTSTSGTLTTTNGVSGTEQHYTLVTTGIPITGATPSATHYGRFLFCYKPALNVMCMDSTQFTQTVRLKVDPIVRLSQTATIQTNTTTPISATLGDAGDNPTVGARVDASCTAANNAVVTVAPAFLNTGSSGSTANFTITTNNLIVYAPSGAAPSGSCLFKTAAGTKSATVTVQGQRLAPVLSVSPNIAHLGGGSTSHTQTFEFSTSPAAPNVPVAVACTGSASPGTGSLTTDSLGKATFTTTASNMVSVHPASRPVTSCSFTLGSLTPVSASIYGVQLSPSLTLSPNSVTGTGTTPIQASLITALGNTNAFPGFTINANCTTTRSDIVVSVTPLSAATNAQGRATFEIKSPLLGFADPGTVTQPPAKCTIQLGSSGTVHTLYMPYSNVCSTGSPYLPLPAACGNP